MKKYENQTFDAERALYALRSGLVSNCSFQGPADGESALKECENITVENCLFGLRYPLWHLNGGRIEADEIHHIILDENKLPGSSCRIISRARPAA